MTRSHRAILLALTLTAIGGCTKRGFLNAPKVDDEVSGQVGSFDSDTHFLLEPNADAEALLGRAVQLSSKGAWTIADERAPGCEVRVKRSTAEYEKTYRMALGDLTAVSGGYRELLKLEARYGRSVEAQVKIRNAETLTADVAGPCGDVIVTSVRVGSGERRLLRRAEASAHGRAGKGPIGVDAGRDAATDVQDEIKWSSPQAYAFGYERVTQHSVFDFTVDAPEVLRDGERLALTVNANKDAFLVVYYLEESGEGAVLYPSHEVPLAKVVGGAPLTLPSAGEAQIQARLRDPAVAARETLVVYAFAERGDYDLYKPQALEAGGDMVGYAAALTKALSRVPISRWSRVTLTYEIRPND